MRRLLLATLGLSLIAGACTSDDDTAGQVDPTSSPSEEDGGTVVLDDDQITLTGGLAAFASCDETLAWIRNEALSRVGPYGLAGYGNYYGPVFAEGDVAFEANEEAALEAPTEGGAAAPLTAGQDGADRTVVGTNTQEVGVDEPDLVKTDGNRIVTLTNGVLTVVDVTGAAPVTVGRVELSEWGYGQELFLAGDKAFIFTNDGGYGYPVPLSLAGGGAVEDRFAPENGIATVRVIEVDLVDPGVLRTLQVEGQYLSARAVAGTARIVLSSGPAELGFVYPSGPAGEDVATQANRQAIEQSVLDDWLPNYRIVEADGTITNEGVLATCERIHRPAVFSGFNAVSVLTLDLAGSLTPGDATALFADGQTVYASESALYVATTQWYDPAIIQPTDGTAPEIVEDYNTAIHKFAIDAGAPAAYQASGKVDGHLLNQFSLDEHNGDLRVVTTDGSPWGGSVDGEGQSQSSLVVLRQNGVSLDQIGKVGGLGQGEQVYSARLVGDRGYIVTFRQVDPLYVLDLSDPANPRVTGELKIPGYSSYLHPLSETLILGVGQDATEEGQTLGTKASLFDVSDPANPQELGVWTLPGAYSDVEYEHRAFLWLAERQQVVLPISSYNDNFVGAVILQVGGDGVAEVGRITQAPAEGAPTTTCDRPTADQVPQETELYYMLQENYGVVLVCDEGEAGGYAGYTCDVWPADQIENYIGASASDLGLEAGQRVEVCWPNGNPYGEPILRTLVIDSTLWSVSYTRLQANSLDGFAVTGQVGL